ncbi:Hsp70 family protein [Specibacter sp. NPDC078709]|uniref:Hsp70 family protein n=1 Tax=Specibacter sp. NPDC078709 TaxID=3154364 RepID=UPI003439A363
MNSNGNARLWRLAIDFGTSNTTAAVQAFGEEPKILRLGTNADSMPSCVALYQGEFVCGVAAMNLAGIAPDCVELTPKRRLGEQSLWLAGRSLDPVLVAGALFHHILQVALREMGQTPPQQVLLTHPEAWGVYMCQRLCDAAARGGIDPRTVVLMSEPVAAAWHFAASGDVPAGANIAVLDFGGGTCDAAVLHYAPGTKEQAFEVVAARGLDPLGGQDFDARLQDWVLGQAVQTGHAELVAKLRDEANSGARATFREQVREVKHALSYSSQAPGVLRVGGDEWIFTVTRNDFEQMLAGPLEQAGRLATDVVAAGAGGPAGLHVIYLSGGSSLIPAVQMKINDVLPQKVATLGDPKTITILGAMRAPVPRIENPPISTPSPETRPPESPPPPPPPPANPTSKPKNGFRVPLLIAGSVVVLALASLGFSALLGSDPGSTSGSSRTPIPPSTSAIVSPPTTPPTTPTEQERLCGAHVLNDLSDAECEVLNGGVSELVDATTCEPGEWGEGSQTAVLACQGNMNIPERSASKVFMVAYPNLPSMRTSEQTLIDDHGLTEGFPDKPKLHHSWVTEGEATSLAKGNIMTWVESETTMWLWTDWQSHILYWVETPASPSQVYAWWRVP